MAALMVTVAVAVLVGSATEVAVTVTIGELGMLAGAMYSPVPSIIPQLAPMQPVPERLQAMAWLAPAGLTVAVNC